MLGEPQRALQLLELRERVLTKARVDARGDESGTLGEDPLPQLVHG